MPLNEADCYKLTEEELKQVKELRSIFHEKIPEDLDTDLNLRRWVHGWKGQMDEIEPRLKLYIQNRKAAKYDQPNHLDTFFDHPLVQKYFKYLAFSRELNVINSKDNGVFLVERIENVDLNNLMKVVTCGDFLHMNFILCEGFMRQILNQEKLSGRPSGMTILYDMSGVKIGDFLNPNSPLMKINKLSMGLFQDYFCDILFKIYLINAPSLFTVAWDVVKHFMNKNTQAKFIPLGSNYEEVLRANIDVNILPVRYGGTKRDDSGLVNPETLCFEPVKITEADFFVAKKFDDWEVAHIKVGGKFEIKKIIEKPSTLQWQYWSNSDIDFAVLKESSSGGIMELLTPRMTFCTPKLPEEGEFVCKEPGEYVLEFTNNSTSWFSLKLDYAVKIEEILTK